VRLRAVGCSFRFGWSDNARLNLVGRAFMVGRLPASDGSEVNFSKNSHVFGDRFLREFCE
jgi:hypothetical protein